MEIPRVKMHTYVVSVVCLTSCREEGFDLVLRTSVMTPIQGVGHDPAIRSAPKDSLRIQSNEDHTSPCQMELTLEQFETRVGSGVRRASLQFTVFT